MTTEEAAFRGILYGGLFTLAGTLIGNAFQIFLQWLQLKWSIKAEKRKGLAPKRLGALQGAVQMCDFLAAASGRTLGSGAMNDWGRIRSENLSNSALIPESAQAAFQNVLSAHLFRDSFEGFAVDFDAVRQLRNLCLAAIKDEFDT